MFTEPKYGWTTLNVGRFSERVSYLTDVPIECLDAFIYALENSVPATVFFDAEGYDYHLVSSYYETYIIIGDKLFISNKDYVDIAKELCCDIEKYFDGWVDWMGYEIDADEDIKRRSDVLKSKLNKLKSLLKNRL